MDTLSQPKPNDYLHVGAGFALGGSTTSLLALVKDVVPPARSFLGRAEMAIVAGLALATPVAFASEEGAWVTRAISMFLPKPCESRTSGGHDVF